MGTGSGTKKGPGMSWRSAAIVIGGAAVAVATAGLALDATVGMPWIEKEAPPRPALMTPAPRPTPEWDPAPEVLTVPTAARASGAPAMADVLGPLVGAPGLGGRVGASVVDLSTGADAYQSGAATAQTPASTLKILTAAAALDVLGPDHVFTTRVVTAAAGLDPAAAQITLVGGGDPTLTAGDTSGGTRLTELADATAQALADAGAASVRLSYDDSLFTGPAVDPDWSPGYVPSQVVSPVSALSVDVADSRPGDPAADAAETFADLLRARGVAVESEPVRAVAPGDRVDVASVESDPVSVIVENILATSDNDGSEALARHVALGAGLPGTSEDASVAVEQTLTDLGIDMTDATVLDGSGLSRDSAVPASVITATLALAADPSHPQLRAVVTGLPVARFSGTLADRFDGTAAAPGAGLVRAKTGTLTGVSGLAGVVVAADGAPYAFAFLADDVSNSVEARAALDDAAAALAQCGCGG